MQRQKSNIGNFVFKHSEKSTPDEASLKKNLTCESTESVNHPSSEKYSAKAEKHLDTDENLKSKSKLNRTALNYSHEDIHALASKAEFLVLTSSNTDLRKLSSEEDNDDDNDVIDEKKTSHERDYVKLSTSSGPYSLDLDNLDNDEPCLSGTWEHDIQEQYISEGSVLGTWDNSMKSVLCFGEDYSNYIRRKSELPSLDNFFMISQDVSGLQATPHDKNTDTIDPVIILRMSERDWLNVVSDLNSDQEDSNQRFGDVEVFSRLLETCKINLETVRNIKIHQDVSPRCLPQDQKDLIETWEDLQSELEQKINQCQAFNKINKEIEIISLKIENISSKKEEIEQFEEEEAQNLVKHFQEVLQNVEIVNPDISDIMTQVQELHSRVSDDKDKDVQKISLLCFCKQEVGSLSEKLTKIHDDVTKIIDYCKTVIERKTDFDKEVAAVEKSVNRHRWIPKRSSSASVINEFDSDKIEELFKILSDLKSTKMITGEYYRSSSKTLHNAEKYLEKHRESICENEGEQQGKGMLFSCMPVVIVTSAIMIYNYCSPAR